MNPLAFLAAFLFITVGVLAWADMWIDAQFGEWE